MSDEPAIYIRRELVERLFDLNLKSMDFGSGFLCHDDVLVLREVASILGEDPMEATPYDLKKHWPHEHRWNRKLIPKDFAERYGYDRNPFSFSAEFNAYVEWDCGRCGQGVQQIQEPGSWDEAHLDFMRRHPNSTPNDIIEWLRTREP